VFFCERAGRGEKSPKGGGDLRVGADGIKSSLTTTTENFPSHGTKNGRNGKTGTNWHERIWGQAKASLRETGQGAEKKRRANPRGEREMGRPKDSKKKRGGIDKKDHQ